MGLLAPAHTPPDIVQRLHAETVAVLDAGDAKEAFAKQGVEVETSSPEAFHSLIQREIVKWSEVVHRAGITVE